jgi:peptidoglycan/LPS O-acetylase OafA/YrhL
VYPESPISYRRDIDGLRGIAVLLVVIFHADARRLPGGFIGVDIFFVISGFLISNIIFKGLEEGKFSFADFYARRVRRIFPALVLVLLAVWILGWFTLTAVEYRQMGQHLEGGGFISNILLWRESGYFDRAAQFKPLLHLWSLGIEEQYYFLWPLTAFTLWKTRFRFWGLLLLFLVSFGLNLGMVATHPAATFYQPQTRFWELLLGGMAAYIHTYKKDQFDDVLRRALFLDSSAKSIFSLQNIKSSFGFLLIVIGFTLINQTAAFPGAWALLPTIGAFLIISAGPAARINKWILSSPILVFVGLISYPLYLWHWPLLSYLWVTGISEPLPQAEFAAVAAAFLLAWLTYRFVEKPFRKRTSIAEQTMGITVLVSAMVIICSLGAITAHTKGIPFRFAGNIRMLATYEDNVHTSGWREDKCYLDPDHDFRSFDSVCTDSAPSAGPLVFLWGDSHAADLYPGIHDLQQKYRFRLAQYTASGCPPVLHYSQPGRRYCTVINDWVFSRVKELHPDMVILGAQTWPYLGLEITQTIRALNAAGLGQIVIVGPTPQWQDQLPKFLFKYAKVGFYHKIPDRLSEGFDRSFFEADRVLKNQAVLNHAIYISPINLLCDSSSCRTLISQGGKTDLVAFDEHHLTLVGSQYVANALLSPLFERMHRTVD